MCLSIYVCIYIYIYMYTYIYIVIEIYRARDGAGALFQPVWVISWSQKGSSQKGSAMVNWSTPIPSCFCLTALLLGIPPWASQPSKYLLCDRASPAAWTWLRTQATYQLRMDNSKTNHVLYVYLYMFITCTDI